MYALHPKKRDKVLVLPELVSSVNGTVDVPKAIGEIKGCHAAWCKTEDWTKNNGNFAPILARWIADRGFTKWPEGYKPPAPPLDDSNFVPYDPFGLLAKREKK